MNHFTQLRLIFAYLTSGATLALALVYTVAFYDSTFKFLAGRGLTLYAIALAVVAFVAALRLRAIVVALFLTLAGLAIWVPPIDAIILEGAIRVPGPILGVIFFAPIFGLGFAKFVTVYRSKKELRKDNHLNIHSPSTTVSEEEASAKHQQQKHF